MNLIKIFIVLLVIGFIFLYLYIIMRNKNNTVYIDRFNTTNINNQPFTKQLSILIAKKLNISQRRIQNLTHSGDISNKFLNISFTILNPNIIEIGNNELPSQTIENNANYLFSQDNFIVKINNVDIKLRKDLQKLSSYYDNTELLNIAEYSKQKYINAPTDKLLTQFYTLQFNKDFELQPILVEQN